MTVNSGSYTSIKFSKGKQNTLYAPAGKVITKVTFYVTSNYPEDASLVEFEGAECADDVTSQKNWDNPTVITKELSNPANSVTFTFGGTQVCVVAVVTYADAPTDYVYAPAISVSGANVTLTSGTDGAKIYYTTDGTEPTSASTEYSSAITMTESATIRAIAINGEYKSEEVAKDVYVAGTGVSATLGYSGGTVEDDTKHIWTSTDGKFTLTDNTDGRTINAVTLSATNDGFKLNHGDDYVLQPAADFKVTKIVVVGKTWLSGNAGNASSISFGGFTPESGSFYDNLTGGSTYVKTLTFTADETVDYGTAIPMDISNNQLGAYIEVYGEYLPAGDATVTWNLEIGTSVTTLNTTSVSASRPSITDVTNLELNNLTLPDKGRDTATPKIETPAEKDESKYVSMTFKVADGYMFTPSNVNLGIVAVSSDKTMQVVISDDISSSASAEVNVGKNDAPASTDFAFEGKSFTGTVTVKIYGYASTEDHYRLGPVVTLTGEVAQYTTTYNNGWVSFTPSFDCAVATEGAAAYIATNVAENTVTMSKVENMKAGNGYFLYAGDSEEKAVSVGPAEAEAPEGNLIQGCTAATEIDGTSNTIYCLGKLNGKGGLYKVSTTLEVPAGKAYLQVPNNGNSVQAPELIFVFDDGSETTAVKGISAQVEKEEVAVGAKRIINGQVVIKTQNGYVNLMGVTVK
ncbi:MAG: chitobiase/beta-hexosaminidase C-terminal domain-containing protein [Prevotella sp.]